MHPARVVFDPFSDIRYLAPETLGYRRQILALRDFFSEQNCTVLLLQEMTRGSPGDIQVEALTHGYLTLHQESPQYGGQRRRVRVHKMRGISFLGGYHDFGIQKSGIRVYPRLVPAEHYDELPDEIVSTGLPGLDQLLGGGCERGSSLLVMGPAGVWNVVTIMTLAQHGVLGEQVHFNGVSVLHRPLSLDTLISTVGAALRARRRQYEIRDLLQNRDESDHRREEFLAMLAHELRNPLSPIRTGLQVLRITESEDLAARVRSMMERQVGNLSRLIDDLLDVSRITRGKISLKMQAVEVFQILNVVVEGRARLAAEKGLQIEFVDRESPALWVNADTMRLEQMIGIPAEMLGTVFELFAQTDRALDRSQGGLGIGLTIVKALAELHEGSVEALSAGEGQGTEIVLRLPALGAQDIVIEARGVKPAPTHFPSRNVLVVEDDREAADILATYLRAQGHTVHVAHDGASGLEAALRERPEAILCDIGLSVMDGYALARALRNVPALANCLLVAVTGYGEARDKERGQEAGFDYHLIKPADPEEIAQLLTQLTFRGPHNADPARDDAGAS